MEAAEATARLGIAFPSAGSEGSGVCSHTPGHTHTPLKGRLVELLSLQPGARPDASPLWGSFSPQK